MGAMSKKAALSALVFLAFVAGGTGYRLWASDHDDGENTNKERTLNLTDHLAWKDTTDATMLNVAMYVNPRSLPGYSYYFAENARYDFHFTRLASNKAAVTGQDDVILRFVFGAPNETTGKQAVNVSLVKDGVETAATAAGATTSFSDSKADVDGTIVQTATIGSTAVKYFVGARQDTFFFDVVRFFEVRSYLAQTFLAHKAVTLSANCNGDNLAAGGLFNNPNCAPDFTYGYNISAIVAQLPIAALQKAGETSFDTWSTISLPQ